MVVGYRVFKGIPQRGATPIEIEIATKIETLLEIDFDHDFDIYPDFPRTENKIALAESCFLLTNPSALCQRFSGSENSPVHHFLINGALSCGCTFSAVRARICPDTI
jgi:hypothetical protein